MRGRNIQIDITSDICLKRAGLPKTSEQNNAIERTRNKIVEKKNYRMKMIQARTIARLRILSSKKARKIQKTRALR